MVMKMIMKMKMNDLKNYDLNALCMDTNNVD